MLRSSPSSASIVCVCVCVTISACTPVGEISGSRCSSPFLAGVILIGVTSRTVHHSRQSNWRKWLQCARVRQLEIHVRAMVGNSSCYSGELIHNCCLTTTLSGSGRFLQIKLQPLGGAIATQDFCTADLHLILLSDHNDNFSKYNKK